MKKFRFSTPHTTNVELVDRKYGEYTSYEITHYGPMQPKAILETVLSAKKMSSRRADLRLSRWGTRKIAVRWYNEQDALRHEKNLVEAARRGKAYELILARLFDKEYPWHQAIVTEWHRGTAQDAKKDEPLPTLQQYILQSHDSLEQKIRTIGLALRKLGSINARRLIHGHPFTHNWVIDSRRTPHLVDYAMLDVVPLRLHPTLKKQFLRVQCMDRNTLLEDAFNHLDKVHPNGVNWQSILEQWTAAYRTGLKNPQWNPY